MTGVLLLAVLVLVLLIMAAPVFIKVTYSGPGPPNRVIVDLWVWRLHWPGRRLLRPPAWVRSSGREPRGSRFTGGRTEPGSVATVWRLLAPLWRKTKTYRPVFLYLVRHVHVEQFSWETRVGVGDPCRTGIVAGVLWALKGAVAGYLRAQDRGRVRYLVRPDFDRSVLDVELRASLKVRLWHVVAAGLMALKLRMVNRTRRPGPRGGKRARPLG